MIAHRGLAAVADDGGGEQLRVSQQLFLRRIGVKIDPEGFHIMKKSEYSGMFGDYSSYSEEYEELADASVELEEEESEDED